MLHLNSDSYNETVSVFGVSLKEDILKALSLIIDVKVTVDQSLGSSQKATLLHLNRHLK